MRKAKLEFDLPEDESELHYALNAGALASALSGFDSYLFNIVDEAELSEVEKTLVEKIWEQWKSDVEDLL